MKIWVVSDTHFYHENIKKYQNRPDNFNELLIQRWNENVKPEDLVIHLGDVIFGPDKEKNLKEVRFDDPSLQPVFLNGKLLVEQTFEEIRDRANGG